MTKVSLKWQALYSSAAVVIYFSGPPGPPGPPGRPAEGEQEGRGPAIVPGAVTFPDREAMIKVTLMTGSLKPS